MLLHVIHASNTHNLFLPPTAIKIFGFFRRTTGIYILSAFITEVNLFAGIMRAAGYE